MHEPADRGDDRASNDQAQGNGRPASTLPALMENAAGDQGVTIAQRRP